jgi:hypothetical protein
MQGQISPGNAAAQLAQKALLMKALQNPPQSFQQRQANNMLPQTAAMQDPAMAANPQLQSMQQQMQQPIPLNLNLPPTDPSLQPQPGIS